LCFPMTEVSKENLDRLITELYGQVEEKGRTDHHRQM